MQSHFAKDQPPRLHNFDTLAARTILRLREQEKLRLCLVLPCRGQERAWPQADQETYLEILLQADEWEFLQGDYTPGCMHRRNRVMASRSGRGIFLWDGRQSGGTAYTFRFFRLLGKGRPIVWENLWPHRQRLAFSSGKPYNQDNTEREV